MILAVSKRWHLVRFHVAGWLLKRVVTPLFHRLGRVTVNSRASAIDQHGKAQQRLEVCMRCPAMLANGAGCRYCSCYMPWKRGLANARCSHPTKPRW